MTDIGKMLIFFGMLMIGIGIVLVFFSKIPFIGKLPGDIVIKRGNFTFIFPLATSLLISVIITFFLWVFKK